MSPLRWILKKLFRHQDHRENDEEREAAGGESSYYQKSNQLLPLPFLLNASDDWKVRYSAQSYGFPDNHLTSTGPANQRFFKDSIYVYVDASVKDGQKTGIGIFFGYEHPLTCYMDITTLVGNQLNAWHDSNLGEVLAAIVALKKLADWDEFEGDPKKVVVRSDSRNMIQQLRQVTNWYNSNGQPKRQQSPFQECLAELYRIADNFREEVEFQHVKAHRGDPGNLVADYLASRALEDWSTSAPGWMAASDSALFQKGRWLSAARPSTITDFLDAVNDLLPPVCQ